MASWAADHEGWPTTCAAADESIVPRIKEHPIYRTACGKSSNKCEARGKGSESGAAEDDEEETEDDELSCDDLVQYGSTTEKECDLNDIEASILACSCVIGRKSGNGPGDVDVESLSFSDGFVIPDGHELVIGADAYVVTVEAGVTITMNRGVIGTNRGVVETNDGRIEVNDGRVEVNDGHLVENNYGAFVTTNKYGAIVEVNYGTVEENYYGNLYVNYGIVESNYNGRIDANWGTIIENTGANIF